jgi:AcrR family transcriptional regulator
LLAAYARCVTQQTTQTRTQGERTAATRTKLLDATLDSLVELGYARTTTQGIAVRAGLSRGAQLHHFPTKESMVVASVEHLAIKREGEIRAELGSTHDLAQALQLLSDAFAGPLFLAALELWVAARTEPPLRRALLPLERQVTEALTVLGADLLDVSPDSRLLELTVELVRGLGMAVLFSTPAGAERRRHRLLADWQHILEQQ